MTQRSNHLTFPFGRFFARTAAALLLGGCGGAEDQLSTADVRGKVLIDDRPLAGAKVTFTPERGRAATAQTDIDGSYTLGTYGRGDGAIVGHHRVTVIAREPGVENSPGAEGMIRPGRSLIPEAYANPATSRLEFDVEAGKENMFDIRLSSKRK